ncbi:hypothetical protein, conserved [Leishmania tarentolae]|uniref:Uncharacterized protein n=1 Tax=Leishmania tarentolae TaxID=5689 RepID=A0A640KJR1_LEITA|nr:hypothetical protein, conserved [Leishmania tarentolae]
MFLLLCPQCGQGEPNTMRVTGSAGSRCASCSFSVLASASAHSLYIAFLLRNSALPLATVLGLYTVQRGAVVHRTRLMHPWRLCLLASHAVRYLHLYDPVEASISVAALGELKCQLPVPTTKFFLSLASSLPQYDSTQLRRVLAGLSRLHVAHYMITAYILKLFLASLTRDVDSATVPTSLMQSGSWPRCAAAKQLASVADMVRILQIHHTQRTMRAFLAAAERSLAPITTTRGGACSLSWLCRKKDDDLGGTSYIDARRMAVQVLFLLEVYVNARVHVAAPHTPLWLLGMVFHAPWRSFTLSELLHIYSRLFPAAAPRRATGCAANVSSTRLMQEPLTEHILHRAGGTEVEGTSGCRCAPSATGEDDAALGAPFSNSDLLTVPAQCRVWRERSSWEEYVLLRCTVWRLAYQPVSKSSGAEARRLLGILTPTLFYQLSAEFGGQMRGSALRCWIEALPRSAVGRCDVVDSTECDAPREGTAVEAAQICIAILQLLYTQYIAAGEEASSLTYSAVACRTEDSVGTADGEGVLVSVQRLATGLRSVASLGLKETGEERDWELLALLLDVHSYSACTGTSVSFAHWLESELHQSGDASNMWRCLSAAQQDARDVLMARWCRFWAHHQRENRLTSPLAKGKCRSATLACSDVDDSVTPRRKLAEKELLLHWCIANLVNKCLQRSHQASQLHGYTTPPPAHLTPPRLSFQQIWRGMLSETVEELDVSHQRAAAGVSTYPAMKLETDLLAIMAESLDLNRAAQLRSGDASSPPLCMSLADIIGESVLPDTLCAVVGQTQGHRTDAHSRTFPSFAEAAMQRGRWRRRMWWAASTSALGTSMSLQAAQVMLLNALFPSASIGGACGSTSRASLRRLSVLWPYRLLAVCLRHSASVHQPEKIRYAATEGCGSEWRVCATPWDLKEIFGLDAEYRTLGLVTQCDSAYPRENPLTSAIGELPATQQSFFTCAKGLSNTLMCNIESLIAWQQRSDMLPANTLRCRGEDGGILPPDLCGSTAAPYRMWHRDDTTMYLSGGHCLEAYPFADSNKGILSNNSSENVLETPFAYGTGALVPLRETVALLTRAAMSLNASFASVFAQLPARSSPCWTSCSETAVSASLWAPLFPFRPFAAVEALYAELCLYFWERCQRLAEVLLSLCVVSKPDSRHNEEASTPAMTAETLAVSGVVEWRLLSRYVRDASPSAEPSCDTLALTSAQDRATALLLPLMWRCVHYCAAEATPAISWTSKCRRPTEGVVHDVWRLQLFATYLRGKLPLPGRCEPAQERLWWCLHAALSDAVPLEKDGSLNGESSVGSEHRAALAEAMDNLKANSRKSQQLDSIAQSTQRPFLFLRDTISSLCDGLGTASMMSGDGDISVTSPIDTYVQRLLPCHPFVHAGSSNMHARFLCGVRLVVLTWMHVLLLESIVVYHPRIFSHECTQQLSCVQTRIKTYEQGLYLTVPSSAPSCKHGIAHYMGPSTRAATRRYALLVECLVRELDAAASKLMTWLRDPCISVS